jgi:diaminopimelate decarboxylase
MDASTTTRGAGPHAFPVNAKGHLEIGGVDAFELVREFGTPLHVLDEGRLRQNCRTYRETLAAAWPNSQVLFASKACCILATCRIAYDEGLGVDVASGGELYTALRAGLPASSLVFHGSNKTADEVEYGLRAGIGRFVVDNEHELDLLEAYTGRLGVRTDILLRLTPGIEPHTHKAIQTGGVDSKFGFGILDGAAYRAAQRAAKLERVRLRGFHAHIGSQVLDLEPFRLEAAACLDFAARVRDDLDVTTEELNLGGGLGIRYLSGDEPPSIAQYVQALVAVIEAKVGEHRLSPPRVFIEPGRSIVGDAGVTLYTIGAIKSIPEVRIYVSVDGGMFENPRPALYGARYEAVLADRPLAEPTEVAAVAGRCCESGDVLIWEASLPVVRSGDILAVFSTGAYTYAMASNYNRFPRPAVALAGGGRARLAVERETYDDLIRKDVAF